MMQWPIDKIYITQYFGENPQIYSRFGMAGHNGLDFRTRFVDSPLGHRYITAALPGEVINVETHSGGYGVHVRMRHEGTSQTVYAHLKKAYVLVGDQLDAGGRLGLSDNTGFSSGPHLHFGYRPDKWEGIYDNGYKGYVDPLPYLEGKPVEEHDIDLAFASQFAGKLLIIPEEHGQVYYVSLTSYKRYPISSVKAEEASLFARDNEWIGMSKADVQKIPLA